MKSHARTEAMKEQEVPTSNDAASSGCRPDIIMFEGNPSLPSILLSPSSSRSSIHSLESSDASCCADNGFELDGLEHQKAKAHYAENCSLSAPDSAELSNFDTKPLINSFLGWKPMYGDVREKNLESYISHIRHKYNAWTHDWLNPVSNELVEMFLRQIDRGTTPRERLLRLQAYYLTISTDDALKTFHYSQSALKKIMVEDDDDRCKVHATRALCMAVTYSGGSQQDKQDVMQYLLNIVQSNGQSVKSHKFAPVMSAAIIGWSFIASHVDDLPDAAIPAVAAFAQQLDTTDMQILCDAAQAIAFIYEFWRDIQTDDVHFQLPCDLQPVIGHLKDVARSDRWTINIFSAKKRRRVRDVLVSVVTSLRHGVGPYYSTRLRARNVPPGAEEDQVEEIGYRCRCRIGDYTCLIDTWTAFWRVEMMKLVFGCGLPQHFPVNLIVSTCLDDEFWDKD
ncbi:hypothetical protein E4U16_002968 [Claviceps sp. LM84 group G4]|nr:hypothetical protein E4U16_002968 [Claviceps sp. LM84 group G4]KAG6086814.1 hypothetical protein E4U33_000057 [Claviceps sp. LM78 group G4]